MVTNENQQWRDEYLREEERREQSAVEAFVDACKTGNVADFRVAASSFNYTGYWPRAF